MICVRLAITQGKNRRVDGSEEFTGKLVIGILNTWNDLISCHAHFKQRVEEVKRGVWQAGGFRC